MLAFPDVEEPFMTSSPVETPVKNQSMLKKVTNSNVWGSSKRSTEHKGQDEDGINDSIISADQVFTAVRC